MNHDISGRIEQKVNLKRLESLYELIKRMNSVDNLSELFEFVIDRVLSLTGGQQGLLLLNNDEQTQGLGTIAASRGFELDKPSLAQALELVSTTVINDVLKQGKPRLIVDLYADGRYEGAVSKNTARFKKIRSVLAVPLKAEEQLVGLIYIDHTREAAFDQSDLDFLNAFASQAALSIYRTRQHDQKIKELTLLNELSRSIVQVLDLNEVLTRIVDEATRMLNVETGSVLLLDKSKSEMLFSISVSKGKRVDIPIRLRIGQGIAGWVVSEGQPIYVNDVSQEPRWFGEVEEDFETSSILCVPLKLNGRVLGALQVLNKKKPYSFGSSDVALLSAFAAWATIAIENARLFEEARQVRQLRILHEAALALSSTLDLDTILSIGLEKSLTVLRAEAGAIRLINVPLFLHDSSNKTNQSLSQTLNLTAPQAQILAEYSELVLHHQVDEVIIIDQSHPMPNILGSANLLKKLGIEALALTSIKVGQEITGILATINVQPHTYNVEEINLLGSLTQIIGLAVQNACLYDERVRAFQHLAAEQQRRIAAETRGAMATIILDMAHTMNNILGALRVWAQKLEIASLTKPQAMLTQFKKEITQIRQNTEEAIILISNMTGPLEEPEIAPTEVNVCLAKAIQSCWWPDHIHLHTDIATNLPLVKANAKRLETVFHNVLSNATQALGSQSGDVFVQTRALPNDWVEISITDNGPGIPFALKDLIFEPGVSSKEGGLGIGLWLVQTFIHQFGGQIELVDSGSGKTTFIITLQPMKIRN